jgi:hypothetical protein
LKLQGAKGYFKGSGEYLEGAPQYLEASKQTSKQTGTGKNFFTSVLQSFYFLFLLKHFIFITVPATSLNS